MNCCDCCDPGDRGASVAVTEAGAGAGEALTAPSPPRPCAALAPQPGGVIYHKVRSAVRNPPLVVHGRAQRSRPGPVDPLELVPGPSPAGLQAVLVSVRLFSKAR